MLLILGADRLLYRGPPVDGDRHRHHAVQLAIGLGAPLQLETAGGGAQAGGFVIDADIPHRLGGGAPQVALLYLEPESAAGSRLRLALQQPTQLLMPPVALLQALSTLGDPSETRPLPVTFAAVCADWLAAAGAVDEPLLTPLDARVIETIATLAASPGSPQPAAALARRVGLSADRLMHLFAEATGVPLRRYALWLKLKLAVAAALQGATLTEAAHAAGFSDSAHLSHSFKAMFGLPPRFLFENRGGLRVHVCA